MFACLFACTMLLSYHNNKYSTVRHDAHCERCSHDIFCSDLFLVHRGGGPTREDTVLGKGEQFGYSAARHKSVALLKARTHPPLVLPKVMRSMYTTNQKPRLVPHGLVILNRIQTLGGGRGGGDKAVVLTRWLHLFFGPLCFHFHLFGLFGGC